MTYILLRYVIHPNSYIFEGGLAEYESKSLPPPIKMTFD